MATTIGDQRQYMALERIRVPENVRPLDLEHVDWLAGSIELLGILVPVVVRSDGEDFELVAGFHRIAAAHKLGLAEVPYVVRDAETEDTDRAVENIARKQLNPYEEARALHAMLARGLTEDGAAQALGWPKQRVTTRVKLLALPERAQEMVGTGVLPLTAVDVLRAIGEVSKPIQQLLIDYLDHDETNWLCERLVDEPGFVIGRAINEIGTKDVWAAFLNGAPRYSIEDLKLGKKTAALYAEAEKLHKQINQYAFGPPEIRFAEADVDQARAAGVLIELDHGSPIITDRALYRELVKGAVKRIVEDLRAKATAAAEQKRKAGRSAKAPVDPMTAAKRDRDAQLRQLADQAHGTNLDLGASLLNGLSAVDPADMDVARFFVYALLGGDYDNSPYTSAGERIHQLAMGGIRLVIDELRADVTKTRKDGTRGRLRIDYGPREPEAALKWLWRFVDGAKTAGELYGRALVVIAAEQHAARMVVPASQRGYPTRWNSHKDLAAKALKKLAGPHIPASLTGLERAVKRAHTAHEKAERTQREQRSATTGQDAESADHAEPDVDTVDQVPTEDLDEPLVPAV